MFSYRITDIIFISKFYITQYFYLINKNYQWNWYNINGIVLWQKTWIFNKKVEVDIDSKFHQQNKTCKNIVMHSHDMWDIFHSKIDLTWHIFSYFFAHIHQDYSRDEILQTSENSTVIGNHHYTLKLYNIGQIVYDR